MKVNLEVMVYGHQLDQMQQLFATSVQVYLYEICTYPVLNMS